MSPRAKNGARSANILDDANDQKTGTGCASMSCELNVFFLSLLDK